MKDKSKKARGYSSPLLKGLLENRNELETNRTRNRMLLAARIDDLLKAKGWKKKDLAEKLNKKPSVITKWLSGTHNFTMDTLSDLESVFGEKISISSKVVYPNFEKSNQTFENKVSEPNFEWGELIIEMKFEYLKTYCQKMEILRTEEILKFEEEYKQKISDKKWYEDIPTRLDYGLRELGDQFIMESFYHSSFLYIFSQFESMMKLAGKTAKNKSNSKLGIRDLQGSHSEVKRTKKYIEKHLGIETFIDDNLWQKVLAYIDLRNQLVHSGKTIENINYAKPNLIDYIFSDKNINVSTHKKRKELSKGESISFRIDKIDYLISFCEVSKDFTNKIFNSLRQLESI